MGFDLPMTLREEGREGEREGGREGGKKGEREREREGERERGGGEGNIDYCYLYKPDYKVHPDPEF